MVMLYHDDIADFIARKNAQEVREDKQGARNEISEQVAKFLESGGAITLCQPGIESKVIRCEPQKSGQGMRVKYKDPTLAGYFQLNVDARA